MNVYCFMAHRQLRLFSAHLNVMIHKPQRNLQLFWYVVKNKPTFVLQIGKISDFENFNKYAHVIHHCKGDFERKTFDSITIVPKLTSL